MCRDNRDQRVVLKAAALWIAFLVPSLACAPKKFHAVQITNVHLHDSGVADSTLDAYVTFRDGEFLYIADCGDSRRFTIPKEWKTGAQIHVFPKKYRVYIRNMAGKGYRCDLLGKKHAKPHGVADQ